MFAVPSKSGQNEVVKKLELYLNIVAVPSKSGQNAGSCIISLCPPHSRRPLKVGSKPPTLL